MPAIQPQQMVIGTTRTDGVLDAGRVDMGYHYNYQGMTTQGVSVTLAPINPPIVHSAGGGSFDYLIAATNSGTSAQPVTVWVQRYSA